jgi:hypothetical protein
MILDLSDKGVGVTERVGLDLLPEEGWFIVRGILKPKNIQPSWSLCRCGLGDTRSNRHSLVGVFTDPVHLAPRVATSFPSARSDSLCFHYLGVAGTLNANSFHSSHMFRRKSIDPIVFVETAPENRVFRFLIVWHITVV